MDEAFASADDKELACVYERGFARVYDYLMRDIPYDEWFEAIRAYLARQGICGGTMCELGCGTGSMTERFAAAGFRVVGIDCSPDMLAVAQDRNNARGLDILYVQQDMEQMELGELVDVVVSVCDSMNYLLEEEALRRVFRRVSRFLRPGGYFIFDLKTIYCYRNIMGCRTWAEQDEEVSYIWENYFYEDEYINEYALTIFQRQPGSRLYERTEEVHYQKAYPVAAVRQALEESGLEVAGCFGPAMQGMPSDDSERVYFAAKKREDDSENGKQDEQ